MILVTGAGRVGRHVVSRLHEAGALRSASSPVIRRWRRVERIPPEVARAEFIESGESPGVADAALALWERLVTEPESVTSTVERITGSPGRTFPEWAVEHASAFG